ncbi:Chromate resistance protein ChrB [Glaciihabitans sp. UYNi722]|uniref:Chromate resistance protein ChrB n=1 Tax=Glaciihabitans sp. UYNi722 TaxID=3156344 RepID=UPI003390BFB1
MDISFNWVLILIQLDAEPSRHRVAVWRELRKLGAVPISAGVWAAPNLEWFMNGLERATELCRRGGGSLFMIDAAPRGEQAEALIYDAFAAARRDEWAEFIADCGKFEEEIAREIAKEKFTFGELEEEEQSLDRLNRWWGDLARRDVLSLPEGVAAAGHLEECRKVLSDYAELVYQRVEISTPATDITNAGFPEGRQS